MRNDASGNTDEIDDANTAGDSGGPATVDLGSVADVAPIKRGRGRPAKSGGGASGKSAPAPSRKETAKSVHVNKDKKTGRRLLVAVHATLARWTDVSQLALTVEQADALTDAAAGLAEEFEMPEMPSRITVIMTAGLVVADVYGPMFMALRNRRTRPAPPPPRPVMSQPSALREQLGID